jgi:hypothetical protein
MTCKIKLPKGQDSLQEKGRRESRKAEEHTFYKSKPKEEAISTGPTPNDVKVQWLYWTTAE